jgi:hypothetical protein
MHYSAPLMSEMGLVSRVSPVQTALRNCTRDEGRSFEVGNQMLISSHRKLVRQSHACNPHGAIIALQHPDTALVWLGSKPALPHSNMGVCFDLQQRTLSIVCSVAP